MTDDPLDPATDDAAERDAGSPAEPARWHRAIAATFTEKVLGTSDWDAPTPVAEWAARDVVRHLVTWLPGFLGAGTQIELPAGPSVDDDPVGAWRAHVDAVQGLLDNPQFAEMPYQSSMFGELTVAEAINQFYTADIFMHTWDLARATGQPDRLDAQTCAHMLAGMSDMELSLIHI